MLKEITFRASMAYNEDDFRETVDAFKAGRFAILIQGATEC
jgi:hypothetical protein